MSDPVAAYLAGLDLHGGPLPPTYPTLDLLLRRHLAVVPYDNLAVMLGRAPAVDPVECVRRVGDVGRAGYCFHHNGALEVVLRTLGFRVRRWHGHVWSGAHEPEDAGELTHLALEVSELPTEDDPTGRWWVDVGLGDCLAGPFPLVAGRHEHRGFRCQVTHVDEHGWRFRHDPAGSFTGMRVLGLPVDQAAVGAAGSRQTELTTDGEWRSTIADRLGLSLDGFADPELRRLYAEQGSRHVAWTEAGRP